MASKHNVIEPSSDVDPVTLEVVRSRADSIAEEMVASLIRTSYSTNIKDRQDASCAVYTSHGEMISQAARASPIHVGTMTFAIGQIIDEFDLEEMRAGDVYIYNTPYPAGPHHLNDITVVSPVLVNGEVYAFVGSQAHHVDVGGTEPGSMPFGVTEIYQEGLQIPPVQLLDAGELNEDILSIIKQNIRTERVTVGDLWAQIAAANTGEKRLQELVEEFGPEETERYTHALMDYAERRMREGIRETIPDGTYSFEDFVEGDSIDDGLISIHAEITVDDDSVFVDFSNSNDQVRGPMNYLPPGVVACVQYAIQAIVEPRMPINEGTSRPIDVQTRKGSVLNPRYPAPVCSAGMVTAQRIVDVILGALKDAVPERVTAACSGTMNLFNIGGISPDNGEYFNYVETYGGGQGAYHDSDGMDGIHTHMTNTRNAPAEVLEHTYPFVIEAYSLVEDSEGAGKYRGGVGIKRDIRIMSDECRITLSSDRQERPPWGIDGGKSARPSTCRIIESDGTVRQLPPKFSTQLEDKGARIVTETPGGGGWGDPAARDPDQVLQDVRAGLISIDRAEEVYRVAITDTHEIDEQETSRLRSEV